MSYYRLLMKKMKLRNLAFLSVVSCATFFAWYSRGQRSASVMMTTPIESSHAPNLLVGYSSIVDGELLMKEGWAVVRQVVYFKGLKGIEAVMDTYQFRGMYSFLATQLSLFGGITTSLLLINWLSWVVAAWALWQLSTRLFSDDLAALLSVLFLCFGSGFLFHINDYTDHALSFVNFYFGVFLLYSSGILFSDQPWKTHVRLGCFLGASCLVYNTGVMLIFIYVANALKRNRWHRVLIITAVALAIRPLWLSYLHFIGTNITDVEKSLFENAIKGWSSASIGSVFQNLTDFLFFDSPFVIIAGVLSFLFLPLDRPTRKFGASVILIPVLTSFVFSTAATARGYLVYGVSIWLYCCLGRTFSVQVRSPRQIVAQAAGFCLAVGLFSHLAWTTAHLRHNFGPVKSYFLGWNGWPVLTNPQPRVMSMTGQEATPIMYGGNGTLVEAGAVSVASFAPLNPELISVPNAFKRQFFFIFLALLIWTVMFLDRMSKPMLVLVPCLFLALISAGSKFFRILPTRFILERGISLPSNKTFHYEVKLSDGFIAALEKELQGDNSLIVNIQADIEPAVFSIGTPMANIPINRTESAALAQLFAVQDKKQALIEMRKSGIFSFRIDNPLNHDIWFQGWQRTDLEGRKISFLGDSKTVAAPLGVLPATELRVCRPDGSLVLAGY